MQFYCFENEVVNELVIREISVFLCDKYLLGGAKRCMATCKVLKAHLLGDVYRTFANFTFGEKFANFLTNVLASMNEQNNYVLYRP